MKRHHPIERSLISALALGPKEHLAIVGAGGKTSLMFALARELRLKGHFIITSTTTKTWYREATLSPSLILTQPDSDWRERLWQELTIHGQVFIAKERLHSGKVAGIQPDLADELFMDPRVGHLILEADGAAGFPLKAPAPNEPVVPSSASVVIAVMGLEALGQALSSKIVFRLERFEEVTGIMRGTKLSPEAVAKVFQEAEGLFKGTPPSARRIAFLNKRDLLSSDREARQLIQILLREPELENAFMGSLLEKRYLLIGKEP